MFTRGDTQFPLSKEITERALALFVDHEYGSLITYKELTKACGDDAQKTRTRNAILLAGRRLLREQNKLLIVVRDVGYRIAHPNEHAGQATRLQKGARRRLRRAAMAVAHVALDALTTTERNRVLTEQVRCALKLGVDRRLSRSKALPAHADVAIPNGRKLIEMFARGKKTA